MTPWEKAFETALKFWIAQGVEPWLAQRYASTDADEEVTRQKEEPKP